MKLVKYIQSGRRWEVINILKYILNIILSYDKYFEYGVFLYMPFIINVYLTNKAFKSCKRKTNVI